MLMPPVCIRWHWCWSRKHFQFDVLPSSAKTAALQHPHFSPCHRPTKKSFYLLHLPLWFVRAACSGLVSVPPKMTCWRTATKPEWKCSDASVATLMCWPLVPKIWATQPSRSCERHKTFVCIVMSICKEVFVSKPQILSYLGTIFATKAAFLQSRNLIFFPKFKGVLQCLCSFFNSWVWTFRYFHNLTLHWECVFLQVVPCAADFKAAWLLCARAPPIADSTHASKSLYHLKEAAENRRRVWFKHSRAVSTLNPFLLPTPWRCREETCRYRWFLRKIQLAGHWRDALTSLSAHRGARAETLIAADVERVMKTNQKRTQAFKYLLSD